MEEISFILSICNKFHLLKNKCSVSFAWLFSVVGQLNSATLSATSQRHGDRAQTVRILKHFFLCFIYSCPFVQKRELWANARRNVKRQSTNCPRIQFVNTFLMDKVSECFQHRMLGKRGKRNSTYQRIVNNNLFKP